MPKSNNNPKTTGERYKDGTEVLYGDDGKPMSQAEAKERRKALRYYTRLGKRHMMSWESGRTGKRFSFANSEEK